MRLENKEMFTGIIYTIMVIGLVSMALLYIVAVHEQTIKMIETDYGKCLHSCKSSGGSGTNFDTKECLINCKPGGL